MSVFAEQAYNSILFLFSPFLKMNKEFFLQIWFHPQDLTKSCLTKFEYLHRKWYQRLSESNRIKPIRKFRNRYCMLQYSVKQRLPGRKCYQGSYHSIQSNKFNTKLYYWLISQFSANLPLCFRPKLTES